MVDRDDEPHRNTKRSWPGVPNRYRISDSSSVIRPKSNATVASGSSPDSVIDTCPAMARSPMTTRATPIGTPKADATSAIDCGRWQSRTIVRCSNCSAAVKAALCLYQRLDPQVAMACHHNQ
jgi:hypothetical protein